MTFKTTFNRDISTESTRLILNALRDSKASGYTLSIQLAKLRQMYHRDINKDKVDSIIAWLAKHGIKATIFVNGIEYKPEQVSTPIKAKRTRTKKVA